MQVTLPGGTGLSRMESRYHDIDIQSLAAAATAYAWPRTMSCRTSDFELNWYARIRRRAPGSLSTLDDGEAVYAQLMLIPPCRTALPPQPREVIFVIDTSGSMEGDSLAQARAALLRGHRPVGRGRSLQPDPVQQIASSCSSSR